MKRTVYAFALFVLVTGTAIPSAQAMTLAEALTKIDSLIAEMQTIRAELASAGTAIAPTPAPVVAGAQATSVFSQDLSYGATNDDIARIQKLLATDADIYPDGIVSGFFGPKTQEAIRRFQSRFGLDTVGVVGPSTKSLFELFLASYPDDNFPADVLKKGAPQAPATATTQSTVSGVASVSTQGSVGSSKVARIEVFEEDDEYIVKSYTKAGDRNRDLILYPEDYDALIEMIAEKLDVTEALVATLISEDDVSFSSRQSRTGGDEGDAEDALEEADELIDEARDEIRKASDDGDDVEEADEYYDDARKAYKEARDAFKEEEYDEAIEKAEEAADLAEKALDELGVSSKKGNDDVDSIEVDVREDEARVTVEYDNGDDERFDVDDTDREDIIAAIADELDMDEGDVEDIVEFDYGDVTRVAVTITEDTTRARVYYESGADEKLSLGSLKDEDDIVKKIAKAIDVDEDDIERVIDIDDRT